MCVGLFMQAQVSDQKRTKELELQDTESSTIHPGAQTPVFCKCVLLTPVSQNKPFLKLTLSGALLLP